MSNTLQPARRRVSLTVRFSIILILAVVIPLIITVLSSEFILSPALTRQAATEMETDAQKHSETIDSYVAARLQELTYVSQFKAIREYLQQNRSTSTYKTQARAELLSSYNLDPGSYTSWTLFQLQSGQKGQTVSAVLSYPQDVPAEQNTTTQQRLNYTIPQTMLDLMGDGLHKTLISNVYYDNALRQAYVNLYVNVYNDRGNAIGIERASLSLSPVWDAVNSEFNAGTRDYSMVIDNHDVCIAYTTTDTTQGTLPGELFKSLAPLSTTFASQIKQEGLYDPTQTKVAVYNNSGDPGMLNLTQNSADAVVAQQFQPAGQNEQYEVIKATDRLLTWSYVVLRPMSTITRAANQQVLYLFLISLVVTLLAAVIGLFVGRSITRPIQHSVDTLRDNSDSLKQLASAEEATAMEQKWIIDSSQIGLQSVQYYANATSSAAQQLNTIGENLLLNWGRMDSAQTKQGLDDIIAAAHYIEKAAEHQKKSCGGLSDAIQVTAQVTDQLVTGATSASDAATQLDKVVFELREVVGK